MEQITRTGTFSALLSAMSRGAAYKFLPNTTLNEKFNVLPKDYPGIGTYPVLSYMALGRGALRGEVSADGQDFYPRILQHTAEDCGMFNYMPFVLRLPENDLPAERRARYAMRTLKNYNGVDYWAYWLRRVDFSQADTNIVIKHKDADGNIVVQTWEPDESNLNPTPIELSSAGANLIAGHSMVSSTIVTLPLDEFDINEITNASKIITGKAGRAVASEVAICTGTAKQIQVQGQGGTFPFLEAQAVQIATFIRALLPFDTLNTALTDQLELGISEPLFNIEGVNA